jgi:hypothetical protein
MFGNKSSIVSPAIAVLIAVIGVLVFVATGTGRRGPSNTTASNRAEKAARSSVAPQPLPEPAPQSVSERGPVQNIRFILYATGVYPREARVQQGAVAIAVEDRTGTSAGLAVERQDESRNVRVGQVKRSTEQGRGRSRFRLDPGRYRVFDVTRPANAAVLLVEP